MKIFRYDKNKHFPIRELSVAMGNFDGLHLGHKSVIELARNKSQAGRFGVLTFDPHPREFFFPQTQPFRLMSNITKQLTLENLKLDILLEVPFTKDIALLEPTEFIKIILSEYFKINHIVIGEDFKFGYKRSGDAQLLKTIGRSLGIMVTIAPLIKTNIIDISSTAVREALKNGNPKKASEMLGEWYSIVGTVIEGDKRGRTLGFPTINLDLSGLHLPKFGVYSAVTKVLTGKYQGSYPAAVSIGERPTYGKNKPNLEAHLLNFSESVYGEQVSVSLIAFQRPEIAFNSSEELIQQMQKDCAIAMQLYEDSACRE